MFTPSRDVGLRTTAPTLFGVEARKAPSWLDARERQVAFGLLDALAMGAATLALTHHVGMAAVLTAPWLMAMGLAGFYQAERRWSPWMVAYEATKALAIASVLVILARVAWPDAFPPALTLALAAGLGIVVPLAWRLPCFKAFAAVPSRWVVIVGADAAGCAIAEEIRRHPQSGFRVVGFVDDDPTRQNRFVAGLPVLGNSARLPLLTEALALDAVVIRSVDLSCQASLVDCIERGASIWTMTAMVEQLCARIPVPLIDATWFIQELRAGQRRLYLAARRAMDVGIALVGLVGTALLFPLIWAAIRLFGGAGPVIYAQRRVGLRGRCFTIYKFRTMRLDAERDGAAWAAAKDDRVTPVGRFLRRSRLDELPQFWNVLKGEMSVVGPRPERPEFTQTLAEQIPFYNRRHMVPPGLTGWAQVMFPYGASVEDALEKLQYDLFYIKHRSFYLDLKIMLKTVGVMMRKFGSR
jgi:exopolysaccharide biosynthesis polyprenyl glycosylphosphotransferase